MSKTPAPESAELLATMRCNLQCAHCCASAGSPLENELSTEEVQRVLAELAELGVKHLCISGGELTLRPDWHVLVASALERFRNVAIITNGRLGARLFDALDRMNRRDALIVMTSLDGTRERHDARRGTGAYDKAIEVLSARSEIRRDVITTVGTDNLGDLDAIGRTLQSLRVGEWTVQPAIPIGRMGRETFLRDPGLRTLADFVRAAGERHPGLRVSTTCSFGYFHPMRAASTWRGCPAGRDRIAILAQGDVSPCVAATDWTCGNVRSQSLRDIWEGAAMAAIRSARPASCASCGRCPGGCEVMDRALGEQFCMVE